MHAHRHRRPPWRTVVVRPRPKVRPAPPPVLPAVPAALIPSPAPQPALTALSSLSPAPPVGPRRPVSRSFYKGDDLHAYTPFLRQRLPEFIVLFSSPVPILEWTALIKDLYHHYPDPGARVALENIQRQYSPAAGWIVNQELPGINFALVLYRLWHMIKAKGESSLYLHFGETLRQISSTCLAGVTDRLFADFLALHEDSKA